ncbi:MAG: replication-relaxation family protein [Thermoanaerobaculia bacterium]
MASSLEVVPAPRTRLRDRDIEALAFIGRGYEVAQYQLHEAVFPSRSPNVVSRFVTRASERGFVAAERLGGIGMNRLRLTRRGREFLIDRGIAEDELFAPGKAVALKDVAHALAINDLRVALLGLKNPPTLISPAWFLQRRISSAPAIPDLLAHWPAGTATRGLLLAWEIDLGCERLATVFLPKLERLRELLNDAAEGDRAGIVVFTRGSRRVELLEGHRGEASIPVMPFTMPNASGSREGILEFRSLLASC